MAVCSGAPRTAKSGKNGRSENKKARQALLPGFDGKNKSHYRKAL
jgi:hypothetical protein